MRRIIDWLIFYGLKLIADQGLNVLKETIFKLRFKKFIFAKILSVYV